MSEYRHLEIEARWRQNWKDQKTYKVTEESSKPKYYVLDMFPYPSGAGLHVGHPLGYIASDIISRYKRQTGFNVLHPMGYDSFGLPAEQYAIQTGQHPAITTKDNVTRYREQLDNIGFSFDWSREVKTSDPKFYRWTQWIFKQLFQSWYNKTTDKAESIEALVATFEKEGNANIKAVCEQEDVFTAEEWNNYTNQQKSDTLLNYRLAYLADTVVNWCEELGTVLANDEVKDGVSERGGHPVIQKKMRQWSLRISAYSERLLQGLEKIDWPLPLKEIQKNWIGKSRGAHVSFDIEGNSQKLDVFTTRPDTIYGVSFMVIAPEHPLVNEITTAEQQNEIKAYQEATAKKTERDRQADVGNPTGVFTGAYALHPFTKEKIQIWIADYVLVGYGTGAIMAVPAGDSRDHLFAKTFNLPIPAIFEGIDIEEAAYEDKEAALANSDFLNGLKPKKAIGQAINKLVEMGIGKAQTNYRLRDAVFSRQRYWGEPFPVYYKDEIPHLTSGDEVVELPPVDKYLPTETGEPPLARAKKEDWNISEGDRMEFNTMPGWAGSSWYFLRYMDPQNDTEFVAKDKVDYWQNVDLYIGGSEHATGHLLYSRFWTKFLYDLGHIPFDEPFQKLINQGMILGRSSFVYRVSFSKSLDSETSKTMGLSNIYISKKYYDLYMDRFSENNQSWEGLEEIKLQIKNQLGFDPIGDITTISKLPVDINFVDNDTLDTNAFKNWRPEYANAEFILEDGQYICGHEVEKMSKSKFNVQTPDDLIEKYGADTLRMYEMFLGPIEQAKPWDTKGITGVHGFLKKFWRLFHPSEQFEVSNEAPSKEALKALHIAIKKVTEDTEKYAFNTAVSTFMIAVNELNKLKCNNRAVLEPLTQLLAPYAPHICEEIWSLLGHTESVTLAPYPKFEAKHVEESSYAYPVSFNGKMRFKLELPKDMDKQTVEETVLGYEKSQAYLDGKAPKKVIVVPGKIVNVVV